MGWLWRRVASSLRISSRLHPRLRAKGDFERITRWKRVLQLPIEFPPGQNAVTQTVDLGTTTANTGIEGVSYDPSTGGYVVVKESQPQGIFQTGVDFAAGTAAGRRRLDRMVSAERRDASADERRGPADRQPTAGR